MKKHIQQSALFSMVGLIMTAFMFFSSCNQIEDPVEAAQQSPTAQFGEKGEGGGEGDGPCRDQVDEKGRVKVKGLTFNEVHPLGVLWYNTLIDANPGLKAFWQEPASWDYVFFMEGTGDPAEDCQCRMSSLEYDFGSIIDPLSGQHVDIYGLDIPLLSATVGNTSAPGTLGPNAFTYDAIKLGGQKIEIIFPSYPLYFVDFDNYTQLPLQQDGGGLCVIQNGDIVHDIPAIALGSFVVSNGGAFRAPIPNLPLQVHEQITNPANYGYERPPFENGIPVNLGPGVQIQP